MAKRFLFRGYLMMVSSTALLVGGLGCGDSSKAQPDATPPPRPDAAVPDASPPPPSGTLQIKTLSNRADLISGGDALVEIVVPASTATSLDQLHVAAGTRDVSAQFALRANGRVIGVITDLADGDNTVTADLKGTTSASLKITNHKIGGPVLSGPQVVPFVCATPLATTGTGDTPSTNASGLSTNAIDAQCNIAKEVKLFYRTTAVPPACTMARPDPSPPGVPPATACFKPFDPTATAPSDLAMTTTDAGVTMPYIVRVERGTLNRGIYDIAVLFDPTKDDPATGWKAVAPQAGWNGKVVYSFGASSGQPRQQFRSEQNWNDDAALSRGFLVAINSMTDSLYNANRVSMSETVMMMKEKIGDSFGEIKYTIGNGCSGGSINQLTTASIFPGLLDGIQPTCTFPDSETTGVEVADCLLLVNAYNAPEWKKLMSDANLTQAQINVKKGAINGHLDHTGCQAWFNSFANLGRPGNYIPMFVLPADNDTGVTTAVPPATNNCKLPASMVYDPASNPTGVRCTGSDHAVAILGKVPGTNHARDSRDNVGVQYGLKAFTSGAITAEEFVTVNELVGGADFDSNHTAARSAGDPEALATVYRAGMVSDGHHLAKVPIVDNRGFDDTNLPPPIGVGGGGIHHVWRSFALRARLDAANGNHSNHVLWRYGTGLIAPAASGLSLQSFLTIDKWVAAIKADATSATLEQKISSHRPVDAVDFCFLTSDTTFATKVTDFALCDGDRFLKKHTSPRQVAGGPLAENILKCQLKPIDRSDYDPFLITDAQLTRLRAVFPDGVCDFSKPGVGQQPAVSPLDFSAGPGGTALPAAPSSTSL